MSLFLDGLGACNLAAPHLTLALGGFVNHRKPLALMVALAETAPRFQPEALICLSGSVDLDLALALWPSIRTLHCPFVGVEGLATISPLVRRALEAQALALIPWDTGLLSLALRTDPETSVATVVGRGTDLPLLNPYLEEREGRIWVRGLQPDLALVHVPYASTAESRLWYEDSPWGDGLFLHPDRPVLATVGALDDPSATARCYVASRSWRCYQIPQATGPTADPPRCEVDAATLRRALDIGQGPEAAAALRHFWTSAFSTVDCELIKLPI